MVAGNDAGLAAALERQAGDKNITAVRAALSDDAANGTARRDRLDGGSTPLEWKSSPISARSLVLAAHNRLGSLDAAVLVCSPLRRFPAGLPDAFEIDTAIDMYVKSYMFVTRELLSHFTKQGGGLLAFVVRGGGGPDGGTLDKTITAAFAAFAEALLGTQGVENLIGFSADIPPASEQTDAFAAFILKLITDERKNDRGRWHKFGKLNLFGR
ncbi:MAG: hypothetical protein LBD20_08520 [Spirochaetaceae bacterium]|nr:hypothetical protein [Spirochaetaceae bacterium]